MGFYSGIRFCLPACPPLVTCADLAGFLRDFAALGAHKDSPFNPEFQRDGRHSAKVRLGKSIDQDLKEMSVMVPVEGAPMLHRVKDRKWTFRVSRASSLLDVAERLDTHAGIIYRADVAIGDADNDTSRSLARTSKEPEGAFFPDSWHFSIGPVTYDEADDGSIFMIAWMELSLSGNGYFFPWTPIECIEQARNHPKVSAAAALCRKWWPVTPTPPTPEIIQARRAMHRCWPYPAFDTPVDWFWSASGCGS